MKPSTEVDILFAEANQTACSADIERMDIMKISVALRGYWYLFVLQPPDNLEPI